MGQEQPVWGREHRRDGNTEWPSTGFSTISGEPRASRTMTRRRRHKRSSYLRFAVPLLLALLLGGVGVLRLAQHLQG